MSIITEPICDSYRCVNFIFTRKIIRHISESKNIKFKLSLGAIMLYMAAPSLLSISPQACAYTIDDHLKCMRDAAGNCNIKTVTSNYIVTDNAAINNKNGRYNPQHGNGGKGFKPDEFNSAKDGGVSGVFLKNDVMSDKEFYLSHYTDKFGFVDKYTSVPGYHNVYLYGADFYAKKDKNNNYAQSHVTFLELDGTCAVNKNALVDIDGLSLHVGVFNGKADKNHLISSVFKSTILDVKNMNVDIGYLNKNKVEHTDPSGVHDFSSTMFLKSSAYSYLNEKCHLGSTCKYDNPAGHSARNYTVKAVNSTLNFISDAHLYSEIVYKTDKTTGMAVRDIDRYGTVLDNSHITFDKTGEFKTLHASNIINKGSSSIKANFGIDKNGKFGSDSLNMKYSDKDKLLHGFAPAEQDKVQDFSSGYDHYGTIHNAGGSKIKFEVDDVFLNSFKEGKRQGGYDRALSMVVSSFNRADVKGYQYKSDKVKLISNLLKYEGKTLSDLIAFSQNNSDNEGRIVSNFDTDDRRIVYTQIFSARENKQFHIHDPDRTDHIWIDVGSLEYMAQVDISHNGFSGSSGKPGQSSHSFKALAADFKDLGVKNVKAPESYKGGRGSDGENAYILGHGGNGGRGGDGGGLMTLALSDAHYVFLNGKASVSVTGADGGDGGNAGKKQLALGSYTAFFKAGGQGHISNSKLHHGQAGSGGDGGSVILKGYSVTGGNSNERSLDIKDLDFKLKAVAGRGGSAGSDVKDGLTYKDADRGEGAKTKARNGKSGYAFVSGIDVLSGATMRIMGNNTIDVRAVVHDKEAFDSDRSNAFALYAKGAGSPFDPKSDSSVIEMRGDLTLRSSIENTDGSKDVKGGGGLYLENTVVAFKDHDGKKADIHSKNSYNRLDTDYAVYAGDNGLVFFTDITDADKNGDTGDSIIINKALSIAKGSRLKIRVHADKAVSNISELPDKYYVASEGLYRLDAVKPHVLIKLPDNEQSRLTKETLASINSSWEQDDGAVKLDLAADIAQDDKTYDIVLNSLSAKKTNKASNSVEAVIDNAFIVNRMGFIVKSQLSERFRRLRQNDRSYGLWAQTLNSDIDFDVRPGDNLQISSRYSVQTLGFDARYTLKDSYFMYGAYAGRGEMKSSFSRIKASSETDDIFAAVYGSYDFNSGMYLESALSYHRFTSDVNASIEGNMQGCDRSHLDMNAIGFMTSAGKRFELPYDFVTDAALKFDYMYFSGKDHTTERSLVIKGQSYSSIGLSVSLLAGKYFNDRNTLVYAGFEYGEYFNDNDKKAEVFDRGRVYRFDNPDYDFGYTNISCGITHRFMDTLEVDLKLNRYAIDESSTDDTGFKGEIRYLF